MKTPKHIRESAVYKLTHELDKEQTEQAIKWLDEAEKRYGRLYITPPKKHFIYALCFNMLPNSLEFIDHAVFFEHAVLTAPHFDPIGGLQERIKELNDLAEEEINHFTCIGKDKTEHVRRKFRLDTYEYYAETVDTVLYADSACPTLITYQLIQPVELSKGMRKVG